MYIKPPSFKRETTFRGLTAIGSILVGGAGALHPFVLGGLGLVFALVFMALWVWRANAVLPAIVCAVIASSALLPLVNIAGLPLDNYVALLATPALVAISIARRAQIDRLLVASLVCLSLAVIGSGLLNSPDSLSSIFRFISYVAVAVSSRTLTMRELKIVRRGMVIVGLALAASIAITAAGLSNLPVYSDAESNGSRFGGLIGHPNFAAYFLGLCVLVVLGAETWRNGPRVALIAVLSSALLLTGSRGALVWLALACLIMLPRWWRLIPVLLVPVAVIAGFLSTVLIERFDHLAETGGLEGGNAAGWRLIQWQYALNIQPQPNVFGVGWGVASRFLPGGLEVHSGYLQVWVELGLLGILGIAAFVSRMLKDALTDLLAASVLTFILITNVTDSVILYPPIMYFLLIMISTKFEEGVEDRSDSISKVVRDEDYVAPPFQESILR